MRTNFDDNEGRSNDSEQNSVIIYSGLCMCTVYTDKEVQNQRWVFNQYGDYLLLLHYIMKGFTIIPSKTDLGK